MQLWFHNCLGQPVLDIFFVRLAKKMDGAIENIDPVLNRVLYISFTLCLSLQSYWFLSVPFSCVTSFFLLLIEWALFPGQLG